MKKLAFALFVSFGLVTAHAASDSSIPSSFVTTINTADSAQYTGKFKYEGMPFEYMEISLKEGKLYFSGGQYNGLLTPASDQKDVFDAGGQAVFTFLRDGQGKIVELQIDYQGQTFVGKKEA